MSLALVEAATTVRRLARRRAVLVVLLLDLAALLYGVLLAPSATAAGALASASALGAFTLLVLSAGIVADDRASGRLAIAATHPVSSGELVAGRWLAVVALSVAVASIVGVPLTLAARGGAPGVAALACALAAAACHLAALGALALLLSCGVGPTPQVLTLLGVIVVGVVPPALAADALPWAALRPPFRALWLLLPAPWALDRLQAWALGLQAAAPLVLGALLVQTPLFLAAGSRALGRAELGARSG